MLAKAKLAPLCQEMRPKCEVLLHSQPTKVKSIHWSKQLTSITTSGFSYCNFVSDEVSMEICWQSDEYVLLLKAILLTRQRTSLKISTNTISCCYLASASSTHVPQSETSLSYLCSSIFTRPLNTGILGIWHTWYLSSTTNLSQYWYIGTQGDIIFLTTTKSCQKPTPRKPLFVGCLRTKGMCYYNNNNSKIDIPSHYPASGWTSANKEANMPALYMSYYANMAVTFVTQNSLQNIWSGDQFLLLCYTKIFDNYIRIYIYNICFSCSPNIWQI